MNLDMVACGELWGEIKTKTPAWAGGYLYLTLICLLFLTEKATRFEEYQMDVSKIREYVQVIPEVCPTSEWKP